MHGKDGRESHNYTDNEPQPENNNNNEKLKGNCKKNTIFIHELEIESGMDGFGQFFVAMLYPGYI